jgi:hypothetical protein
VATITVAFNLSVYGILEKNKLIDNIISRNATHCKKIVNLAVFFSPYEQPVSVEYHVHIRRGKNSKHDESSGSPTLAVSPHPLLYIYIIILIILFGGVI